jgi:hypothetical protein
VSTSLINQFNPVKCAERLKAELKALPKFLPEPIAVDWERIHASLKADASPARP